MNTPATDPNSGSRESDQERILRTHQIRLATQSTHWLARQEELAVVRLALDLEILHGTKDPLGRLAEAAKLLTEARRALQSEADRPEREQKEHSQRIAKAAVEATRVPWSKIFLEARVDGQPTQEPRAHRFKISERVEFESTVGDPPRPVTEFRYDTKEFTWTVFTSKKGWDLLLSKHVRSIFDRKKAKIRESLAPLILKMVTSKALSVGDKQSMDQAVRACIEELRRFWPTEQSNAELQKCTTVQDINEWMATWFPRLHGSTIRKLDAMARNGRLSQLELFHLYQSRLRK